MSGVSPVNRPGYISHGSVIGYLPSSPPLSSENPEAAQGFFDLEYRGARFSLGYGACPNLEDRVTMMELLEPERIGVELSEELQLHPEQSIDAFVLHQPEAKYYNV